MSKDKGSKNKKKAPADKSVGKSKSAYQDEGKSGADKHSTMPEATTPKPDPKGGGKRKS